MGAAESGPRHIRAPATGRIPVLKPLVNRHQVDEQVFGCPFSSEPFTQSLGFSLGREATYLPAAPRWFTTILVLDQPDAERLCVSLRGSLHTSIMPALQPPMRSRRNILCSRRVR